MAHRLLCLNERSDERPCGAGTKTSRMEESTRTHRGLGGMAESRPAGRAESNGGGGRAVSIRSHFGGETTPLGQGTPQGFPRRDIPRHTPKSMTGDYTHASPEAMEDATERVVGCAVN